MKVNFSLHNIEAKRFNYPKGPVNINNNSTLTAVSEVEGKLSVNFVFTANYEPNIEQVKIEGEVRIPESKKNVEEALREWVDSGRKNLPKDVAQRVHNAILGNCIVEATILSRDVQLPPPIPSPNVKLDSNADVVGKDDTNMYIR